MSRIPRDFVNDLLARIDIVELIHQTVPLKKTGANYSACCPFHSEKTPSFTVSQSKQFYHCFGCGAHGNAIGFLMSYDHLEFIEAIETLAQRLGLTVPQQTPSASSSQNKEQSLYAAMEKAARFYQTQLNHSLPAKNYLQQRQLTPETQQKFQLGFASNSWDSLLRQYPGHDQLLECGMVLAGKQGRYYDRFRNRIMFPIRDLRGRIIGFGGRSLGNELPKYLNSPETALFHKGSEVYGLYEVLHSASNTQQIIIVEGYMDVISLHQHGIPQAVATLGTAVGIKHLQRLLRHCQNLIFCFDGDTAGQKASWRALEICLEIMQDGYEMRFMLLPPKEDPDSLIQKEGSSGFRQRMDQALSIDDFFFRYLGETANLSRLDGRAKAASLGKQLLSKTRNGIFQQLMLDKLAQIVGTTSDSLGEVENKPIKYRGPALPSPQQKAFGPVQLIIALLLQYPETGRDLQLPSTWKEMKMAGCKIISKLVELIQSHPHITTGALLEYWRDTEIAQKLASLATRDLLTPAEGAKAELNATLIKLFSLQREQQIQQLIEKSTTEELSPPDKELLLNLFKQRQEAM